MLLSILPFSEMPPPAPYTPLPYIENNPAFCTGAYVFNTSLIGLVLRPNVIRPHWSPENPPTASFANNWPFKELVANAVVGYRELIASLCDWSVSCPVTGLIAESRRMKAFRPLGPMSRVARMPHDEVDKALLKMPTWLDMLEAG